MCNSPNKIMVSYQDVLATAHHGRMDAVWSVMPCVKGDLPDEAWIKRSMMDPADVNVIDNAIMCSDDTEDDRRKHGNAMRYPGCKKFDHISNYGRTFDNEDGDIEHGYSIWDPKDPYPLTKEDIAIVRTVFFKYFKPEEWAARDPRYIVKSKNRRLVDFRADNLVLGIPSAPKTRKHAKTGARLRGNMKYPQKFCRDEVNRSFNNISDAFGQVLSCVPEADYSVVSKAIKTNGSAYGFSFEKS
jgi:hypothetical protein